MDKLFQSTFDFFSHALPGACITVALYLLDKDTTSLKSFLEVADGIDIGAGVILLLTGYILGFAFYPLGRWLYKKVGFRLWKKELTRNVDLFISDKYILIRELSPANFKYVEIWNMFCAMSQNLAFSCLVVFLIVGFKVVFLSPGNLGFWLGLMAGLVFLFFLLLHRAVVFSVWAADDMNAAIRQLGLEERAEKLRG